SIWGRRDGESPAEEAHEGQAGEHQSQADAHDAQAPATEHQAQEPAPAFWRAQGETPAPLERDPAEAPPPAYEHVPDNPPPAGGPPTMGPTSAYGQQEPSEAPAPAISEAQGVGAPLPMLTGVVIAGEEDQGSPPDEAQEPTVTGIEQPAAVEAQQP